MEQFIEIISEATPADIELALQELKVKYSGLECGIHLYEVAAGYQLRTNHENSPWLFKMNKAKPVRLGRSTLETLSIVAYRQPVTKPEVDDIRGVDSGHILRQLLERNLIKIIGKREEPGNPLIYGTTPDFLSFFSLQSLGELPTLREYTELGEESMKKLHELMPEAAELAGDPVAAEQTSTLEDTAVIAASFESISENNHENQSNDTVVPERDDLPETEQTPS